MKEAIGKLMGVVRSLDSEAEAESRNYGYLTQLLGENGIPAELMEMFEIGMPYSFEIPFWGNCIRINKPEEMKKWQDICKSQIPGDKTPVWPDDWLSISRSGLDQIFINKDDNNRIYYKYHDKAEPSFIIADNLADYIKFLTEWTRLYAVQYNEEIYDFETDLFIKPFFDELEPVLIKTVGEICARNIIDKFIEG